MCAEAIKTRQRTHVIRTEQSSICSDRKGRREKDERKSKCPLPDLEYIVR